MAISWDWVIAVLIIVGLILAIWARVTHQTIKGLLVDIRDFLGDMRGETEERVEELAYYD